MLQAVQIEPQQASSRQAALALLLLIPVPTIGVLAAMVIPATAGTPLGQAIFALSKAWLLAFPLAWLILVEREPIHISRPWRAPGIGVGTLTGLTIGAAIVAAYLLFGSSWIDADTMRAKITAIGIDSRAKYIALKIYMVFINSLLEEYVWRWFVVGRCVRLMPGRAAVVAGALFFTMHHVIAVAAQFDWRITLLASVGVFVGGLTWSWLYWRYGSIWPAYVSHVLADVAVFAIGWKILFG